MQGLFSFIELTDKKEVIPLIHELVSKLNQPSRWYVGIL